MRKPGTLTKAWPIVPTEQAAGSFAVAVDTPCKIWKIVLQGGSAATTGQWYNGSLSTEDMLFSCAAAVGDTVDVDFAEVGGLPFSVKCGAIIEGTAGTSYTWYES